MTGESGHRASSPILLCLTEAEAEEMMRLALGDEPGGRVPLSRINQLILQRDAPQVLRRIALALGHARSPSSFEAARAVDDGDRMRKLQALIARAFDEGWGFEEFLKRRSKGGSE